MFQEEEGRVEVMKEREGKEEMGRDGMGCEAVRLRMNERRKGKGEEQKALG